MIISTKQTNIEILLAFTNINTFSLENLTFECIAHSILKISNCKDVSLISITIKNPLNTSELTPIRIDTSTILKASLSFENEQADKSYQKKYYLSVVNSAIRELSQATRNMYISISFPLMHTSSISDVTIKDMWIDATGIQRSPLEFLSSDLKLHQVKIKKFDGQIIAMQNGSLECIGCIINEDLNGNICEEESQRRINEATLFSSDAPDNTLSETTPSESYLIFIEGVSNLLVADSSFSVLTEFISREGEIHIPKVFNLNTRNERCNGLEVRTNKPISFERCTFKHVKTNSVTDAVPTNKQLVSELAGLFIHIVDINEYSDVTIAGCTFEGILNTTFPSFSENKEEEEEIYCHRRDADSRNAIEEEESTTQTFDCTTSSSSSSSSSMSSIKQHKMASTE
ncbi:uncharacterized protein MONOS_14734 [Monocercomonoides exilis]|uniref:uncharacterized protein n=1 Tax=Monocercomonoides exilis TaxID=2049356 RepID=UPI00355A2A62|nr:hypothetical protein MONOS_14734 [Monocercomonoides exilis]|eukprot:MONOS_14734.1-p1 / transcript=MONOS_14734.1 / gene=MONOS_14734 / organism=Monocercomonoides_exilis_PA203 / gene_product=unspecified product / transcript_product=unspecified product / location=Mono_scaffold01061:5925-7255(-) / protein_length=400 / sequence_SO=supercontig / SO=protein_coding / is_pseudo=false